MHYIKLYTKSWLSSTKYYGENLVEIINCQSTISESLPFDIKICYGYDPEFYKDCNMYSFILAGSIPDVGEEYDAWNASEITQESADFINELAKYEDIPPLDGQYISRELAGNMPVVIVIPEINPTISIFDGETIEFENNIYQFNFYDIENW